MKQITVNEMYLALKKAVEDGQGNRLLVTADDNEGNGYHGVFYTISEFDGTYDEGMKRIIQSMITDSTENDPKKLMIIG